MVGWLTSGVAETSYLSGTGTGTTWVGTWSGCRLWVGGAYDLDTSCVVRDWTLGCGGMHGEHSCVALDTSVNAFVQVAWDIWKGRLIRLRIGMGEVTG